MRESGGRSAGRMHRYAVLAVATGAMLAFEAGAQRATSTAPAEVTAQLQAQQAHVALVNQVLSRFQGDATAQFGAEFAQTTWQREFGMRLLQVSNSSLAQMATAGTLNAAQTIAGQAKPVSIKHSLDTELRWNNLVNPCRIVDTRFGGGGQLGPNWRYWQASAAAGVIGAQGGNPAGCGTITNAQGWILYVTAVPTPGNTSTNFLTVQHDLGPEPVPFGTPATMNWRGDNIAAFAVVGNNTSGGEGFFAYSSSNVHVVIDLVGYLTAQTTVNLQSQTLDCVGGSTTENVVSIAAGTSTSITSQTCPAGYVLTGTGVWTSLTSQIGDVSLSTTENYGLNRGFCQVHNFSGSARSVVCTARCCRLPSVNVSTN